MRPALLGETALVVVGCGPTGLAALVQAALEGMPAVGIEEGEAPLASILNYTDGLVFTSPAFHYEVGGLPLDCRAVDHVTREDVLHYYARVITHLGLDVHCRTKCLALKPRKGFVEVLVQTPTGQGVYRAKRVLVTSWFESRPLPSANLSPDHGIAIYSGLQNPIQLAGRQVIIVGGGMSAYEYATRMMLQGQRIVLLSRGGPSLRDRNPRFRGLLDATGSAVWQPISDLQVGRSTVTFVHHGVRHELPCDALLTAIGRRLREDVLAILATAGALSEQEACCLRSARSWERLRREFPREDEASLLARAWAELPDLREQIFAGRCGIHLAGGALHVGSSNAGVMYSIFTAVLAVRAMAGHPLPPGAGAPLSEYFATLTLPEEAPAQLAFARIALLRPLSIPGRGRPSMLPEVTENGWGQQARHDGARFGTDPQLLAGDPEAARILRAADGRSSVAQLAERFGMRTVAERTILRQLLRYLWKNDALTWLPAAGAMTPVPDLEPAPLSYFQSP